MKDGIDIQAIPTSGIKLASQRLNTVKSSLASKVHLLFEEFGIPVHPVMSTIQTVDTMNQIISSVMSLLEVFSCDLGSQSAREITK
jgi:hypothetical protein